MRVLQVVSSLILAVGVLLVWGATFVFTLYMAIFNVPLSLVQSLVLGITAPTKLRLLALIKSWAYSTPSGDAISAFAMNSTAYSRD